MKKLSILIAVFITVIPMLMCSCSATRQCEPSALTDAVAHAQSVIATVYEVGEESFELDGGEPLAELLQGSWEKCSGSSGGKKVLSVTVSMQYEVCFFDNGVAMIYYGFCNVFEKDRQYYEVTLDSGLDSFVEYINENGTAQVVDDRNG